MLFIHSNGGNLPRATNEENRFSLSTFSHRIYRRTRGEYLTATNEKNVFEICITKELPDCLLLTIYLNFHLTHVFFRLGSCPVIPESNEGKILTILYAAFGIPLLLFYLTAVGSAISSCLMQCPLLHFRYRSSIRRRRDQHSSIASGHNMSSVPTVVMTTRLDSGHHQQPNELLFHHPMKTAAVVVKDDESIEATSSTSSDANRLVLRIHSFWPPLFCLILILIFIISGTCVFSSLMSLSTMDALFLSFMLLTTTGIPDAHSAVWTGQSSWPLMAVSVYIFLALTLCSICFSLIYEWLLIEGNSCDPSVESDATRHRRSSNFRS